MTLIDIPSDKRKRHTMQGNHIPCIVCGKPIKSAVWYLHVVDGGDKACLPEDEWLCGASDLGWLPIGLCCLKANPQMMDYAQKLEK